MNVIEDIVDLVHSSCKSVQIVTDVTVLAVAFLHIFHRFNHPVNESWNTTSNLVSYQVVSLLDNLRTFKDLRYLEGVTISVISSLKLFQLGNNIPPEVILNEPLNVFLRTFLIVVIHKSNEDPLEIVYH